MNINSEIQLYNEFKKESGQIIRFDEAKLAFRFHEKISEMLKKKKLRQVNPELEKKYSKLLVKLSWVALPFFKKDTVKGIFNSHFEIAFYLENFSLWEKFKQFLLTIILTDDRDLFKAEIKHILENNKGRLTSDRLGGGEAPTVENWIKKYTASVGTGIVDSVKMRQFLVSNKDVKKLKPDELNRLNIFLDFYERLKLSSSTVQGFEESLPINTPDFKGFIQNGKLEREPRLDRKTRQLLDVVMGIGEKEYDVDKEISDLEKEENNYADGTLQRKMLDEKLKREKKIKELQKVADGYKKNSFERKAVLEEIDKLKKI